MPGRLGGRRGPFLLKSLMEAAEAYAAERDREALRLLRPVREALPDAPSVRELNGLVQYRLGHYRAAACSELSLRSCRHGNLKAAQADAFGHAA